MFAELRWILFLLDHLMTVARSSLVSMAATPYYHVIGRCVRRAFLCGVDALSGRSYEHRRGWIVERLALLSSVYAIEICAYAVMSNHYHLVVKLSSQVTDTWSNNQVLDRWCSLYAGHPLIQRYRSGESLSNGELTVVSDLVDRYRQRLADLSWFMRSLNHDIARRANAEDNCTGHFWEGRFKSQALLDEQALISCMAYVDLNPIRASIADTPEQSDYTSIQQRINGLKKDTTTKLINTEPLSNAVPRLLVFSARLGDDHGLPFSLVDYLELIDWSGHAIHPQKQDKIADDDPPILLRLGIAPDHLLHYLSRQERSFSQVIGKPSSIRNAVKQLGMHFLKGIATAQRLFPQPN